jgi:hypothetical protein
MVPPMKHKISRRTLVRQIDIIAWARERAGDKILVMQLDCLVDKSQHLAPWNIFLLGLVHYKDGTSLAFLELKFSLERGRGEVEQGAD